MTIGPRTSGRSRSRRDHVGASIARGGLRMIHKGSIKARLMIGIAAVIVVAAACSSAAPAGSGAASGAKYTIGFSNPGGVGNGWREAMLCSAKAQAVKAGNVSKVTIIHRDTDAPGQLSDIRTLIAQGVNAIIINPAGPDALNPAIAEAIAAGITVIAVDASVTAPGAYNLSNDQEQYAYLGASWLFKAMNDKGAVVYMRGIAGHPADTDRDTGFQRALKEHPGITIAGAAVTNPASIGGAGVTLALQILGGKKPAATTVHVTPELWANDDPAGKASLTAAADPSLPKTWPLGLTIKDWTTYTKAELIACKGPGDA